MYRFSYLILVSILGTYLLVGFLLFLFQRKFIYYPTNRVDHNFKEIVFENDGEKIRVISINEGSKSAIVYFGGNAESVASTAIDFQQNFPLHSTFLVNYRGYGGSSGTPSEDGIYSDALSFFDSLTPEYDHISVMGRSLGSAVATYVASQRAVTQLVLIAPFDSIQSIAQEQYPYYPVSILLKDKFDSAGRSEKIKSKTLVLIAKDDQVVARAHTEKLVRSLNSINPVVVELDRSGHNNISDHRQYYSTINEFLK